MEPTYTAGIFRLFKPTAIEIVCTGKESSEVIEDYVRRGLTPIIVKHTDDPIVAQLETFAEKL